MDQHYSKCHRPNPTVSILHISTDFQVAEDDREKKDEESKEVKQIKEGKGREGGNNWL
jgi:hypothetical protein